MKVPIDKCNDSLRTERKPVICFIFNRVCASWLLSAPVGAVAVPVSQSSLMVLWVPKNGFQGVSLYILRSADSGNDTDWVTTESASYTFQGLDSKTEYTFDLA